MSSKVAIHPGIRLHASKKDELFENPVTVYVNKFDEDAVTKLREAVQRAEAVYQPVIPVVIDSYGGQVYSLLSMVDILKHASKPVATIVSGKAMSCGAILFSCGAPGMRFVGQNATIMIHDVSCFAHGKVEEVKVTAKEAARLNKKIYELMARNTGHSLHYFTDIVQQKGHADWILTPKEAIYHNLATKIGFPDFSVKVSLEVTFD